MRNPRRFAPSGPDGFTLIELVVVVALIAFVYAIAMPGLTGPGATQTATTLGRINSDVRAAYDLTVLSGRPHRLVFELQSGDYWLEESDTRNIVLGDSKLEKDPSEEEIKAAQEEFEEQFQEYVELAGEPIIDPDTDEEIRPTAPILEAKAALRGPQWSRVDSLEWSKRSLGNDLMILSMQAEHHQSKVSVADSGPDARAFIHFLPTGYVEKAYLHIYYTKDEGVPDEDKEPYTIYTNPWEGTSTIESGYREIDLDER